MFPHVKVKMIQIRQVYGPCSGSSSTYWLWKVLFRKSHVTRHMVAHHYAWATYILWQPVVHYLVQANHSQKISVLIVHKPTQQNMWVYQIITSNTCPNIDAELLLVSVCLFLCSFFFSNSDYIASNKEVISKLWIGKDDEVSSHSLIAAGV
jgi:hypothetical protein